MYTEVHGDLYQFSFDTQRWFPLPLRPPKKAKGAAGGVCRRRVGRACGRVNRWLLLVTAEINVIKTPQSTLVIES